MRSAVALRARRRLTWVEARRAPEIGISIFAVVAVAFLVVHRYGGGEPPGGGSVHAPAEEAAMMAAMMMPLAGPSARLVAQRSLRTRWVRSVAEHLAGFTAVWFVYGVAAVLAVRLLSVLADPVIVLVLLLTAAAAWQVCPVRRQKIQRCGRVRTAPPNGWRADLGSTLSGSWHAVSCVTTCWASMLAMVAAPHPVLMGTVLAASLSEWAPGPNPLGAARRRRPAAVYLAVAAGALLLSVARLGVTGE